MFAGHGWVGLLVTSAFRSVVRDRVRPLVWANSSGGAGSCRHVGRTLSVRRSALLEKYGVALWMPEGGGPVTAGHDELVALLGILAKREIIRARARTVGAMTALVLEENPELADAEFVNDGNVIVAVNPVRKDTYRAMRDQRDQPCSCGHPPVRLELRTTLAEAAASTLTVRRLAFLGQWCEPGRRVDKHGGPVSAELAGLCEQIGIDAPPGLKIRKLRDVPRLAEIWRLEVRADVVREGRTRAIPGPRAELADTVANMGTMHHVDRFYEGVAWVILLPCPCRPGEFPGDSARSVR